MNSSKLPKRVKDHSSGEQYAKRFGWQAFCEATVKGFQVVTAIRCDMDAV